jgi:hypothetical protein
MRPEAGRSIRARVATIVATGLLVLSSACGKNIGDECTYNTDCDPQGTRVCDVAQPSGYCTIEGCDNRTNACPEDSVCVRFFPTAGMIVACAPEHEAVCSDRTPGCDPADPACCRCTAGEECIAEGYCIRRELERRNCMATCGSDADCRDVYACFATGVGGAELIPHDDGTPPGVARFCAPRG